MPPPKARQRRRQPARPPQPARAQQPGKPQEPARPPERSAEQPVADLSGPGCAEVTGQQVLRHAVTATCWLDPGDSGQPRPVSVKFTGHKPGVGGRPRQGDRFERVEMIDRVLPGSGPVSVTAKVPDVTPGEWIVWARPASGPAPGGPTLLPAPPARRLGLMRFLWAKGNPVPGGNTGTNITTRTGVLATGPGLIPASWLPLVAVGVVVALAVQAVLAGRAHLGAVTVLAVSLAASVAGAAGARVWYVALNRGNVQGIPTQGLCIQGFVAGLVVVLIPGVLLAGLPVGTFLDVTAPGLLFAMAIGRQGCVLHGCCTGRLTGSRWGIWASDGRLGARRAPTRQLESLACLVIGLAALLLVLHAPRPAGGTVFVGALAGYTMIRQLLFPYRAEARRSPSGRVASMLGAGLVLIADIIIAIVT